MATAQDSTLTSTINRPVDPFSAVGQISRIEDPMKRSTAARQVREKFLREEASAREAESMEKARLTRAQLDEETAQKGKELASFEKAEQQMKETIGQEPMRKISEFDVNAGLELAGLTALLGAFAGSVSGQAGLRAMEGISRGYREGREDLYNRELKTYEDELVRYKNKIEQAKMVFENSLKKEAIKRGLGQVELKKLDPEIQQSFIGAQTRTFSTKKVLEALDAAEKLGNDIQEKLIVATSKGGLQGGEPSKDERDRIVMRASLQDRIPKLKKIVEENKDQLGLKTLLNEQVLSRVYLEGVVLRSALAQIDGDYRFSKGGKALTKNENEILKGVSDWRGKSADAILKQLEALENYVKTDQNIYERLYPGYMSRLSEFSSQPATRKSFATEADADMAFANGQIKDGEKITIGNRNATYRAD